MQARNHLYLISLFLFIVVTCCSPERPERFVLPNPSLFAFRHQLDLARIKETLTQGDSTVALPTIDGGLLLYSDLVGHICTLWISESLLIVYVDAFCHHRALGVGDMALIQAQNRQNSRNRLNYLLDSSPKGFRLSSVNPLRSDCDYFPVEFGEDVPFEGIFPVDALTWQTSAFGKNARYNFKNGYLHGPFNTLASTGLFQQGYYNNGYESGLWEYYDTTGNLQYEEEYASKGELQKVRQERNATFEGKKPLPTLKYLWSVHRIMFVLLGLSMLWLSIRYLLTFRHFERPYKGKSAGEIILSVLIISPVSALSVAFLSLVLIMLVSTGLGQLLAWDLPFHLLDVLQGVLVLPIVECLWLWITNKFYDVIWHILIVVNAVLLLGERHFLSKLATYL